MSAKPEITTRPAEKEDYEELTGIYMRAVEAGHNVAKDDPRRIVSKMTGYFNGLANRGLWDEKAHILVAAQNGQMAGFICTKGGNNDTEAEIDSLYIDPACQGRGVGTGLLEQATTILQNTSVSALNLWADANDPQLDKFYTKSGWRRCEGVTTSNPLGRIKTLVLYRKDI